MRLKLAWMSCVASHCLVACHPAASSAGVDAGVAPSATKPSAPVDAVSTLYVPGAEPFLQVLARGTQNYTCLLGDGGPAWGPAVPDAILYDADGGAVGKHFAGPTWVWTADQSSFVGSKVAAEGFASIPSPDDAGVDVPWLRLPRKNGTKAAGEAGMLGSATFVQRVNTQGGVVTNQALGCDACSAPTAGGW